MVLNGKYDKSELSYTSPIIKYNRFVLLFQVFHENIMKNLLKQETSYEKFFLIIRVLCIHYIYYS